MITPNELKRYLEGKLDVQQTQEIRDWLTNPDREDEVRQILEQIWSSSEIRLNSPPPDFNRMLDHLHYQINRQNLTEPENRTIGSRFHAAFMKIAAALVIPLLLSSVFFYLKSTKNTSCQVVNTYHEIHTRPGTSTQLTLSDGTVVWLNHGTTFRYPDQFCGNTREVYLDGEACFDVKSNLKVPFVVHNPLMNTIVTGTKFNINAYSKDKYFDATLIRGKITLKNDKNAIVMNPGEQVVFDAVREKVTQSKINPENTTGWINGELVLKDEKLEIAVKKLSRWYNIEIKLAPELNDFLLTATISNENIDQSLKLLTRALPIKYNIKEFKDGIQYRKIIYISNK